MTEFDLLEANKMLKERRRQFAQLRDAVSLPISESSSWDDSATLSSANGQSNGIPSFDTQRHGRFGLVGQYKAKRPSAPLVPGQERKTQRQVPLILVNVYLCSDRRVRSAHREKTRLELKLILGG